MIVMAICDVMTMNFFWLVRDEGSWLDIGTSISHFVIASLLCVFVAGLEFLSEVFVSGVEVGDEEDKALKVKEQERVVNGTVGRDGHAEGGTINGI